MRSILFGRALDSVRRLRALCVSSAPLSQTFRSFGIHPRKNRQKKVFDCKTINTPFAFFIEFAFRVGGVYKNRCLTHGASLVRSPVCLILCAGCGLRRCYLRHSAWAGFLDFAPPPRSDTRTPLNRTKIDDLRPGLLLGWISGFRTPPRIDTRTPPNRIKFDDFMVWAPPGLDSWISHPLPEVTHAPL